MHTGKSGPSACMRRLQLQLQVSKRVWPWVTARLQSPTQRCFLLRLQTLIQLLSLTRKSSMTWWKLPKASSGNERWGIALGSKRRCEELCFRGPFPIQILLARVWCVAYRNPTMFGLQLWYVLIAWWVCIAEICLDGDSVGGGLVGVFTHSHVICIGL